MPDALEVYFDYTCRYSYRAMHWLDRVPDVNVLWRTFSLKEVNKDPEEPSWLEPGSPPSLSVFALALSHAAREADFDRYHRSVFEAMQGEERHLEEPDFLAIAAEAGVDVSAFNANRRAWIGKVAAEHREAVESWKVYGTPTILIDGAAAFVRLKEVPESGEAAELLAALDGIASSPADLAEIFRPDGPKPTPIQIGPPNG